MELNKNEKLRETAEEQSGRLDKANIEKVKQIITPLSNVEKKEAVKLFSDELILNEFVERFYNYKEFALNMMQSINDMKAKVGVDEWDCGTKI